MTPPNTGNYQISKGIVSFSTDNGSSFRDLGNVPSATWQPTVDKLDHFSSRAGIKTKDKSVAVTSSATLKLQMDEIVADNIAMLALGDVESNSDGDSVIKSMTLSSIEGIIQIVGTNDVGLKVDFIGEVSFTPTGQYDFISQEWNSMEITGDMVLHATYGLGQFTVHDEGVTA